MSSATLVQRLGGLAAVDYHRLPAQVRESVRLRLLDTIGLCLGALPLPTSRAVYDYVRETGGAPQSHAFGLPEPVPAAAAALVNGVLAHSLDYDDTHLPSVLHPSAAVIPAALAVAEQRHASGRELVAAVAVGLEICVRLGMAGYDAQTRDSLYFAHGQHATSICGTLGAAAAAAMLHGLPPAGVAHTLGVAASMAAGIIEANRTGGTVKRMHCGWAAHAGVTAAELVRRGITGPPTVLEGRFGFFQAFLHGRYDPAAVTDRLGETWAVPDIFFKPYPANHFTHAGIDAALALRAQGLHPDQLVEARLGVAGPTIATIGAPIELKRAPETGYQAQFSGPYTVVAALIGGGGLGLGLADFTDTLATDPYRRALMARVRVEAEPWCEEIYPYQLPAVLTVRTTDGRELRQPVPHNRGGPQAPLSGPELATKFHDNAARSVAEPVARRFAELAMAVDQLADLAELHDHAAGRRVPTGGG